MPDGENQALFLLAAGGAAAIFVISRPRDRTLVPPLPPPPEPPIVTFQIDGQRCTVQEDVATFIQGLVRSGAVLPANATQLFIDGDLRAFIDRGFGATPTGITIPQIFLLMRICRAEAPPPGPPPPPLPPPPPVTFILQGTVCNPNTLLAHIDALAAIGRVSAQNVSTLLGDGDVDAFIQRAFGRNGFNLERAFAVGRACAGETPPVDGEPPPPQPPPPAPPPTLLPLSFAGRLCDQDAVWAYIVRLEAAGLVTAANVQTLRQDHDLDAFRRRAQNRNGFGNAHLWELRFACFDGIAPSLTYRFEGGICNANRLWNYLVGLLLNVERAIPSLQALLPLARDGDVDAFIQRHALTDLQIRNIRVSCAA